MLKSFYFFPHYLIVRDARIFSYDCYTMWIHTKKIVGGKHKRNPSRISPTRSDQFSSDIYRRFVYCNIIRTLLCGASASVKYSSVSAAAPVRGQQSQDWGEITTRVVITSSKTVSQKNGERNNKTKNETK